MADVRRLDQVNLGLVLVSFVVAHLVPIELLVIVYIFVGPAHYLTEISWLHERQYFTKFRWDSLILVGLGLAIFVLYDLGYQYIILVVTFFLAISMALTSRWAVRIGSTALASIAAILLIAFETPTVWFFVFLPNLIHIVVFTSMFILVGALRNNSRFGFATLAALILCSFTFFAPTNIHIGSSAYGLENVALIQGMYEGLFDVFQVGMDDPFSRNLIGFVAFVNTYHYLNWFSKTGVIRWHQVPASRLAAVGFVYAISIGLYLYDYALGFKVLLLLSFLHVVLEFPLNALSTVEAGRLIKRRLAPVS